MSALTPQQAYKIRCVIEELATGDFTYGTEDITFGPRFLERTILEQTPMLAMKAWQAYLSVSPADASEFYVDNFEDIPEMSRMAIATTFL